MKVIACYSVKGGVGKSTLAANLAWASATCSARRTLLWDLDAQGGGGYLLGVDRGLGEESRHLLSQASAAQARTVPTQFPGLDVLPADPALHGIERVLAKLGKKRRLAKLAESLAERYDRIILDCPPVLNELSRQVMRAADVIVVPLTASPLARRALDDVLESLRRDHPGHGPVLPVFAMFDARRKLHVAAREAQPDWPVIPMASVVEQMSVVRKPVGAIARTAPATEAVKLLWRGIERRLAEG